MANPRGMGNCIMVDSCSGLYSIYILGVFNCWRTIFPHCLHTWNRYLVWVVVAMGQDKLLNIDLQANGFLIQIGMPLDRNILEGVGFEKPSFFMRGSTNQFKRDGDEVYWIKNPELVYFHDRESAVTPNQKGNIPTDLICATSVFLYFNNGNLREVIAQVFMSYFWAQEFTDKFRALATGKLGEAESSEPIIFPVGKGSGKTSSRSPEILRWHNQASSITSTLDNSGNKAFLFWEKL